MSLDSSSLDWQFEIERDTDRWRLIPSFFAILQAFKAMGMAILLIVVSVSLHLFCLVGCTDSLQAARKLGGTYQQQHREQVGQIRSTPDFTGSTFRPEFWRKLLAEDAIGTGNNSNGDAKVPEHKGQENIKHTVHEMENNQEKRGAKEDEPAPQKAETKSNDPGSQAVSRQENKSIDNMEKKPEPEKADEKGKEEIKAETAKTVREDAEKSGTLDQGKVGEEVRTDTQNVVEEVHKLGETDSKQSNEPQTQGGVAVPSRELQGEQNHARNDTELKNSDPIVEEATAKHPENGEKSDEQKEQQRIVSQTDFQEVPREQANQSNVNIEGGGGNSLKLEEQKTESQAWKLEERQEQNSSGVEEKQNGMQEEKTEMEADVSKSEVDTPGDEQQRVRSIEEETRNDVNEQQDDDSVENGRTDDSNSDGKTEKQENEAQGENMMAESGEQQKEKESREEEKSELKAKEEAEEDVGGKVVESQLEELKRGENAFEKAEVVGDDDEYSDIMQELAGLPFKFQKTAGKVADHLRPDVQRWTDASKVYFNLANKQITDSFSPIIGKEYAPLLASLVSYALLLLPLSIVIMLFEHIRALFSLQTVILFVNIYLSAYFATLFSACLLIGIEPMSFFYKSSTSGYLYLQLLEALGYVVYLILQTANIITSCTSDTIVGKLSATIQWGAAILVGLHYYVTVFHLAVALKPPRTNWKFYAIYSGAFFILCLLARVKWVKKQYTNTGDGITDKKN